ncbi:MAG TPA: formate dehydrogenase accessory sulfurtransferase FdhD [Tepidiformaceae bacterium]|nr:formate dehydrogenase accessory sulfurtransferase FdhD [Tepidiformaceae bacterium]
MRDGRRETAPDVLTVEEPLEIRVTAGAGGERVTVPLCVTMRTPGHDFDLAAGFLFGEGIISNREDIARIGLAPDVLDDEERANTVQVDLRDGLAFDTERLRRNFTATSACGVCGKASLDTLVHEGCRPLKSMARIHGDVLVSLPAAMTAAQGGFAHTGGVHACALFTTDGRLLTLREDVGRHNALDKLVGSHLLAGDLAALEASAVMLSGRASYELLQKALRARIPIVASVGAPSSLAVEIARTFDVTLAGFVKPSGFNVYAGGGRIDG